MDTITSSQNTTYKHIRKLLENKKLRQNTKEFWADGANFINEAISNKYKVKKLVYVPEDIDSDFKENILSKVSEDKLFPISQNLYSPLSTKGNIQGIGAVLEQQYEENKLSDGFTIVLENISNPGNLGTIIRTAVAFNIKNICIINPAVDPYSIETVRASMSGIFSVNLFVFDSIEEIKNYLEDNSKYLCIGTSLKERSMDLKKYNKKFKPQDNTLLWFGNEAKGMSETAEDLCSELLKISINPQIDSLNISVSAGICLYELLS